MARVDDYRESFRLASEELRRVDLEERAGAAGAQITRTRAGEAELRMPFIGLPLIVRVGGDVDVVREGPGGELPLPEKILVCHYLLHASEKSPTGRLITFRQIPDGHFYYDAFQRRARDPFLSTFGKDAGLFMACARQLGGEPVDSGDVGMAFRVLPMITIQLALWQGDDEFPPEASLLFDETIQYHLAVEDIAVLSGMLVYRLMGIARSQQNAAQG